jgi:hypothetical protein
MSHQLITFVGFKSSGKNTAAEALLPFGFVPLSFADALKDALASIFCWDRTLLEGITTESRLWREQGDPWWAAKLDIPHFTPRWAMTHFGTEVMRRHFNNDIWVFNVERRLNMLDAPAVIIDSRFPNEIAMARRYGGRVIRIQRGADPEWLPLAITANRDPEPLIRDYALKLLVHAGIHATEYAWIGTEMDATLVNDGTVDDLHVKVIEHCLSDAVPSR